MSKFKRRLAEKMGAKMMEVSVEEWDALTKAVKKLEEEKARDWALIEQIHYMTNL